MQIAYVTFMEGFQNLPTWRAFHLHNFPFFFVTVNLQKFVYTKCMIQKG